MPKIYVALPDNATIKVKTKANPRRSDSVQYERYDVILKHDGKTLGEFFNNGGDSYAIRHAIDQGHVTVWCEVELPLAAWIGKK